MPSDKEKHGVFEIRCDCGTLQEIHVCDCDCEGLVAGNHQLNADCFCNPQKQEESGIPIYVHKSLQ